MLQARPLSFARRDGISRPLRSPVDEGYRARDVLYSILEGLKNALAHTVRTKFSSFLSNQTHKSRVTTIKSDGTTVANRPRFYVDLNYFS
jgi:hypothetical protein